MGTRKGTINCFLELNKQQPVCAESIVKTITFDKGLEFAEHEKIAKGLSADIDFTHPDVMVKGFRNIQYGHKIHLSSDAYGFLTDCRIEQGNPNDKALFLSVLQVHQQDDQRLPMRTMADGGFASQTHVVEGRELGVQSVGFQKSVGLTLTQMGLTKKTLKKRANFRAGVEGNLSEFKRVFGCSVARWKGKEGFEAFVGSSILSYQLIRWVRMQC